MALDASPIAAPETWSIVAVGRLAGPDNNEKHASKAKQLFIFLVAMPSMAYGPHVNRMLNIATGHASDVN